MKNMRNFILAILLSIASTMAIGQDHQKQFKELQSKSDTAGQLKLLKIWEIAKPQDPELFIAYFNFYAQKSMSEVISLDRVPKSEQAFEISDTGTGKPVAYFNSSVNYNSAILQKGFEYIDKGIALYPDRLDMRFGKIYMLGQAENYQLFTKVLIETIEHGNTIKDAWIWKENKPLEDGKQFFLASMQNYVMTIYNTENDHLLPLMRDISKTVLKYAPAHVESLSNVAITHLILKEYDEALTYLFKAEKASPKDVIVLNNIAQAYKRKKDNANAKLYLEKIIKIGNNEESENAKEQMKGLD